MGTRLWAMPVGDMLEGLLTSWVTALTNEYKNVLMPRDDAICHRGGPNRVMGQF